MRTKRKNYFCVLIILLVLIEITSIFLMYKSSNNRETRLDNVNLKEKIQEMKGIAIMLEQDDGTYIESSTNTFPTAMTFNATKSGCIDNLGNKINDAITYINGVINVMTSSTSYCYLYFFNPTPAGEKIKENGNLTTTSIGGLYRYTGFGADNYICFGTTDQSECLNNPDAYMHRIIGITDGTDAQGSGLVANQLKIMKETSIGNYAMGGALYEYLNGEYLNSISSKWSNTIDNVGWREDSIPDYMEYPGLEGPNGSTGSGGTYQIGLIYASDYEQAAANRKAGWSCKDGYCGSWMTENEGAGWTQTGLYDDTDTLSGYLVGTSGNAENNISAFLWDTTFDSLSSTRPTFFLKDSMLLIGGSGTSTNPYIISPKDPINLDTLIANAGDDLWESTLEDDGYRFVGTDPSNYICFGTTDTSACTGNTDLYMYRIIGIFEDSTGKQHLKLIKKEALNTAYAWNADYETDIAWDESDLYKGINGNYFLTNTTYSYMQDTNWTSKIATWNYTATNTKTYESSGPDYYNSVTVQKIYLHEMNRSSKTSSVGLWDTVSAKIGLMYVSDYLLSLGSSALSYTTYTNSATLKTGWMHITNNDSGAPSQYEWTMSRYGGDDGDGYSAWAVRSIGYVNWPRVDNTNSVRPVFYLTSDVELSGEGTSGNPFIIS